MHQMTLQALSLHIEHLFQCMHSSQDRRRMHYSVCSLLWVRRKSDKFRWKLAGEGYLSSRTPFRRGHSDSWTGWTWNALICCGSPLPNYCQLGCAACVFAKSGWCACMSLSVPSACVCQSSRQRGGRGGGGGGGTDCPSVSQSSLSVLRGAVSSCSRRFCSQPPPLRHHLLMLLRRVCQSSTGIKPPETPSSLPLALYRLVVTQT